MSTTTPLLLDEPALKTLGIAIARAYRALRDTGVMTPVILYLQGPLGAGKTTLVRALLQALGVSDAIKSPTYSLIEVYALAEQLIVHGDFYRVQQPEEVSFIGLSDYLNDNTLCCFEWPELAGTYLPPADLLITLQVAEHARQITLLPQTDNGALLYANLQNG